MSTIASEDRSRAGDGASLRNQVALVCRHPAFWRFLAEMHHRQCENEHEAAAFVRQFCGVVDSARLRSLGRQFETWLLRRNRSGSAVRSRSAA